MKNLKTRLGAFSLALCLALGMTTSVLAVDANTMKQASKDAGFTYQYEPATHATAAVKGGRASAAITPSSKLAKDGDVYAAVNTTKGVRFVRTTNDDGSYLVNYAKFGESDFDMMLIQPAIDGGVINIATSYTRSGNYYNFTYTTTLKMSDELAKIAAVNKDDEKMQNMIFSVYVDDPYINSLTSIDTSKVTLNSAVYDPSTLKVQKVDGNWTATYQLKDGWNEGTTAAVKERLQQQMTLTIESDMIPYSTLQKYLVKDTTVNKLYTHGWLTITYRDNDGNQNIPGLVDLQQITLPANLAELSIWSPPSSSGGSASTPEVLNGADHIAYVVGFTDGLVHPEENITRGQFAAILYRLLTHEHRSEIYTTTNKFSDVSYNLWSNKAISSMSNGGYVYGYQDGTFRSEQSITHAEFVAMLVRFIGIDEDAVANFTDVSRSYWAYQYIATATKAGWIKGYNDGSYQPNRCITRAEAMTIMNRVLNRGVNAESELVDYYKWPDNDPSAWYYWDVVEATNDHRYTGSRPSEDWISLEIDYEYDIEHFEHP